MELVTFNRDGSLSQNFEKLTLLPNMAETDPCVIAYSDALFALDTMAEHGMFFTLMMPPELCGPERLEAFQFHQKYSEMLSKLAGPAPSELTSWALTIREAILPFIEFKAKMEDAQRAGKLRSLVFPSFFNHTRHEAERWCRRLEQLSKGEPEYDKVEVTSFWSEISSEHAEFVSHMLDPEEKTLVKAAENHVSIFHEISANSEVEPGTVLAALEAMLGFSTSTVRGLEAGKISSIIDPVLADHVRREQLKGLDELKRAV